LKTPAYTTPFAYPKTRHTRRLSPGPFSTHQSYKPYLRDEFEKKCVYCRMPVTMKDEALFGADHYRPQIRFPGLAATYTNLFYCCNPCNSRKGDYWPSKRRAKTHFFPNPCDHEMFQHLRFVGTRVEVKSQAGQTAFDLLDLNEDGEEGVVAYRDFIVDAIRTYNIKREEALGVLKHLRNLAAKQKSPNPVLDADIAVAEQELRKTETHLARLTGT
jgi:hypothetical protein